MDDLKTKLDFFLLYAHPLSRNKNMASLAEIDSLEALIIIDNELDILSTPVPGPVDQIGNMGEIASRARTNVHDRGECSKEIRMDAICCAAWGFSVLLVTFTLPSY
jgi:hypothetical protein